VVATARRLSLKALVEWATGTATRQLGDVNKAMAATSPKKA
jgi:hypothetical protein